jgi:chromosome segregation ATPase
MSLLEAELEPAVQQLLIRNQDLERENGVLLEKVEILMAELSSLRAKRRSFSRSVEFSATSQATSTLTPTKEVKRKIKQQEDQISRLRSECEAALADIQTVQREKQQLEEYLEKETVEFEKAQQMESEAQSAVRTIADLLASIYPESAPQTEGSTTDLMSSMQILQNHISKLKETYVMDGSRRKDIETERNMHLSTIRGLESRIVALETEKSVIDECNRKYETERKELGKAIETLRGALEEVKESLLSADEEKRKLEEENSMLWKERNEMTLT